MSKILSGVHEAIGNTPIVNLSRITTKVDEERKETYW